ncbi:MAG: hypothetical protein AAGD11_16540 [Planctomycetota bacterium]
MTSSNGRAPPAALTDFLTLDSTSMPSQPHMTGFLPRAIGLIALTNLLALSGCGSSDVARLEDYLEELEFDRPLESVKEIKVNSYRVPCAARRQDAAGGDVEPLWVQMKFDLYVIAEEKDEKSVLAGIERHRGMLDDTVHTVCRQSSIDHLLDARWSAIETRLLDAIRPLLGEQRVRQITFSSSMSWEPI